MKKLFALLLALCCMWTTAGAESDTQTYTWSDYSYEVPATWYLQKGDAVEEEYHCSALWQNQYAQEDVLIDESLSLYYRLSSVWIDLEHTEDLEWAHESGLPELMQGAYRDSAYIYHEGMLQNGLMFAWAEMGYGALEESIPAVVSDGHLKVSVQVYYDSLGNEAHHEIIRAYIVDNVVVPIFNTVRISGYAIMDGGSTAAAKAAAEAEAAAKAAAEAEAAAKAAAEAEAAALAALKKYVVITAESGRIRTVASISGGLIRKAYEGETFELIREESDWYIIDVDGRKGYIHKGVSAILEN